MAATYNVRPSSLLEIGDPYTAYCFDEACALITANMRDGKEPQFRVKYTSLSELYDSLGV